MAHANEQTIRDAYAAFGRGDLEGYLASCVDDFVFNVPGRSRVAGTYRGRAEFMRLIGTVMELSGGKFEEDVLDVLANERHGVVLAVHRFSRDGAPKQYLTAHVYGIRDGKLAECWEQPRDPAAFDQA
jgi:ketosteroid isomerase-like protein